MLRKNFTIFSENVIATQTRVQVRPNFRVAMVQVLVLRARKTINDGICATGG